MSSATDDMPIALRKPKRRSSVLSSPVKPRSAPDSVEGTKTPATRRSKRVRFSDPGLLSPTHATSTSLTPAFRRSTLATPKQRRPATPARPAIEGSIQFTPFTAILDERCIRRIRRNGLSEEMNNYESEKKSRSTLQNEIDAKDAELKRLRAELEAAKVEAQRMDDEVHEPPPSSQQQVDEVEAELEMLRQSFQAAAEDNTSMANQHVSWEDVPRISGPGSEGGDTIVIHEDEDAATFPSGQRQPSFTARAMDTDVLNMGLELSAARQAKSSLLGSFREQATNTTFDLDFADTPVRQQQDVRSTASTFRIPDTPPNFHHDLSKQLRETTNRAEEAEVALTALDVEITNLGFGNADKDDTFAMVAAIADHFRSARLELERLIPGETASGFENSSVLPEILRKTKLLADRVKAKENKLKASKDQHHNLKNNFEKAIIAAEKANERVKQLENAIDGNAEEMLHIRMRSQQLEQDVLEKEKDVTSLSHALNKYRADVSRLENLINDMQQEYDQHTVNVNKKETKIEELEARVSSETNGRRAAEVSAVQRLARINELETSLATSKRHAADLEARLTSLQQSDPASFSASTSFAHTQEIQQLNHRISSLATALACANAEVEKLKISKQKLEERVRSEVEQGAKAVETLQEQLIRTVMKGNEARKRYVNGAKVRIANWQLDDEREMDLSSDGIGEDGQSLASEARTPSSVRFAEYAEVETIERIDGAPEADQLPDAHDGAESGSESIPGSVEVQRGRGRYQKVPRLVSFDKARRAGGGGKGRRRYDSGIGMSSDNDFDIYDEETRGRGASEVRNGMITPELSSEGDVEGVIDEAMVLIGTVLLTHFGNVA
ncbi:hypothetical protein LTS08_002462 [Lithohypha guttulata]|nr:hypothetical protein LTS08_002462 [Lithohypha guttulata]